MTNKSEFSDSALVRELAIKNKLGLHARPAAMFVKIANKFPCEILVEKDNEQVNGKSIMGLMMLAAGCGSILRVSVQGDQSEEAMEEIAGLVERNFDEE